MEVILFVLILGGIWMFSYLHSISMKLDNLNKKLNNLDMDVFRISLKCNHCRK